MPANRDPEIVVEGLEEIIKRDLLKHKSHVETTKIEIDTFRAARAHEIKRKKHYSKLIGGGKYNDEALRKAAGDIAVNIRHMSDRVDLAEQKLAHHTEIVDTLTLQLADQDAGLAVLAEYRRKNPEG